MAFPKKNPDEKKKAISFSLSNKDRELIQKVQEMYHLNSLAEAIMFSIRHAAAGRIAMVGQKIVSALDGSAHEKAQSKPEKSGEKKQATLGLTEEK